MSLPLRPPVWRQCCNQMFLAGLSGRPAEIVIRPRLNKNPNQPITQHARRSVRRYKLTVARSAYLNGFALLPIDRISSKR